MDGSCPKCGNGAVPINPYDWEEEFDDREVPEAHKHIYHTGMELWACLKSDCELLFIIHPDDT